MLNCPKSISFEKNLYSLENFAENHFGDVLSRPASQNTLERTRDESRQWIYTRKILHVYAL